MAATTIIDQSGIQSPLQRDARLTRGRKFNAEELQLLLLWSLGGEPAHGYELIKRFDELSYGYYSPSPGVLYPALGQIESAGLAQVELKGKRKNYRITPAGRDYLQCHAEHTQHLLAIFRHAAKKMLWMNQSTENEAAAAQATGWLPEFVRAGRALRASLLAHSEADHTEQRRIAAILRRATQEIQQVPAGDDITRANSREQ
ncbi:PadR family transcriptional regulator [Pusillimonas sp. MFBS29]|uniref:PadR family transcriptional regulator n=1 Tax=Pusillimonas sp. MFBS29 TaxID=2886690 RepID=UPI001D12033F|nr:PadR family transcriptional regulator [Pusillimonas sp. MFBS29]MCC2596918.1 PadR family transcriptional regulator [Pusillimonas sp. MFBS29]